MGGGGGGGHFIQEWNHLCNFYTGHYSEHFCEKILNLGLWFSWRHFVLFSFFGSGSYFVQQSGTICAILAESISGNICENIFSISTRGSGDVIQKLFFYF